MTLADVSVYTILLIAAVLSYRTGKLTRTGAVVGDIVGVFIYKGAGVTGLILLAAFFILGLWATKWQIDKKTLTGVAEKNKGRRTAWQVLANGGISAILGLMAWQSPAHSVFVQVMIAGSLAAATADTLSSELGTVYGRRFFNILTFKKDTRGLDGVVSIEGTLIGLIGAMLIAAIYSISLGWSVVFCWIALAGAVGNLIDSVLGAALERRGLIGNNLVNFLNTFTGAMVCWLLVGMG
ncbi:DUF92 domain-containing protein [Mucilaginibacter sp. dw_454]|uniref:DUF92 domain-containing protein n=1 Tax=Mucilaginibacter sp. dw_454 TaxID=2720079 RepID=UPI001BD22967|nr:DUF92 domain-containing protein [Mucilaginibacter sp. dw_454]